MFSRYSASTVSTRCCHTPSVGTKTRLITASTGRVTSAAITSVASVQPLKPMRCQREEWKPAA
ncbi:hypothetical protein [Azospirillum brasilense]|uniref:hypothetical protein n=1 Tax=Azospirillum brasilense TaxID=192 RepID=UPI0030B8B292